MAGLVVMAVGYIALSIPITANAGNTSWLLTLTCIALFFIAFGNGLFKGNLQAIVGQMYDDLEAEAAKKGEKELIEAKSKRFRIPDILCIYQYWWTYRSVYRSFVEKLVAECTQYGLQCWSSCSVP